jgi:hypothetical protein
VHDFRTEQELGRFKVSSFLQKHSVGRLKLIRDVAGSLTGSWVYISPGFIPKNEEIGFPKNVLKSVKLPNNVVNIVDVPQMLQEQVRSFGRHLVIVVGGWGHYFNGRLNLSDVVYFIFRVLVRKVGNQPWMLIYVYGGTFIPEFPGPGVLGLVLDTTIKSQVSPHIGEPRNGGFFQLLNVCIKPLKKLGLIIEIYGVKWSAIKRIGGVVLIYESVKEIIAHGLSLKNVI